MLSFLFTKKMDQPYQETLDNPENKRRSSKAVWERGTKYPLSEHENFFSSGPFLA